MASSVLIQRAFAGETVTVPPVWYDPRQLTQVRIEKGNRVGMSATFFPLFAPGGKVSHVGIVFNDLTAEMVQREQLEEERELLSAIIDQVSEGITRCDERGTLRIVNRAARELGVRAGTLHRPADRARTRRRRPRRVGAGPHCVYGHASAIDLDGFALAAFLAQF